MTTAAAAKGYKLIELNLISAQDLATISRTMHTYAIAWINPIRKLTTRIDPKGHNNPKWNDRFLFRVDDEFLNSDTASAFIEIYARAWCRDLLVGSVNVLVASLVPNHKPSAKRFVALQIRRPSGRPQGILNVGVSVHDGRLKSMPIFSDVTAASSTTLSGITDSNSNSKSNHGKQRTRVGSQLRRIKSERSWSELEDPKSKPGSVINNATKSSICNGSGIVNGSDLCSDVGPSPSVVAAAVAKGLYPIRASAPAMKDDAASSVIQWSDDQSEEGLRSKLQRWKMEMGPLAPENRRQRARVQGKRRGYASRREGRNGGGYTCFGKMFGCEFTIVCGAGGGDGSRKHSSKVHLSPSDNSSASMSHIDYDRCGTTKKKRKQVSVMYQCE